MKGLENKEDAKEFILMHVNLLKQALKESGMVIGFNKTADSLMFIDRNTYIKTGKCEGFEIPIKKFSY